MPDVAMIEISACTSLDEARVAFLHALNDFVRDPTVPAGVRAQEVRATMNAVWQIGELAGALDA